MYLFRQGNFSRRESQRQRLEISVIGNLKGSALGVMGTAEMPECC